MTQITKTMKIYKVCTWKMHEIQRVISINNPDKLSLRLLKSRRHGLLSVPLLK